MVSAKNQTTCLALIFAILLFAPITLLPAADWTPVGSVGFRSGGSYESLFVYNGTPYIAYSDVNNYWGATVMTFNGIDWVPVGTPGFSVGAVEYMSLYVYNGTPYVAYQDISQGPNYGGVTVKKFDGAGWVTVGNATFSPAIANCESLFVYNGTPYVAFQDNGSGKAMVMKFDGVIWVPVGDPAGFSTGSTWYESLYVYNGTPYVAYEDEELNSKVTVKMFDGNNWVNVGSPGFSAGESHYVSLKVHNGTPYVAYRDNVSNATVMAYNGSGWVTVGPAEFAFGAPVAYTSLDFYHDMPCVGYRMGSPTKANVMIFNGSNWENVGTPAFSSGSVSYVSLFIENEKIYAGFQETIASIMGVSVWVYDFSTPTVTQTTEFTGTTTPTFSVTPTFSMTKTFTATMTETQTFTSTPTCKNTPTITPTTPPFCFELTGSFPNPAAGHVDILYNLCRGSEIKAEIFTITGEKVCLIKSHGGMGKNAISWNCRNESNADASSGIYIYSIEAVSGDEREKKWGKLSVLK